MCGFVGVLSTSIWNRAELAKPILMRMADKIAARGPDDFGIWHDEVGIGLAHRRLSILDLTAAGHQPMTCATGRYVIVFNGEIYNHLVIRKELEDIGCAPVWRGHSDTETLLAAITAWGVKAAIERCVGMFAFALWDKHEHVLTLGRDRLGEKPLYYGWQGNGKDACFLFGSEVKAFKAHPAFTAEIDREALSLLMCYNCIPAPYSIYQGIYKLPPGHLLTVSLAKRGPILEAYWSLAQVAVSGVASPLQGSPEELVDGLEVLLKSAVHQQMLADVPLGAFLSGGIDSSTVVALMQAQSNQPIKTFTIGFDEAGYNEAVHAKAVARHLGTNHMELYVTDQQTLDIIPKLPSLYSEPFSDSSQIPTFLVSQLARQKVKVSLSGDGGDELFGGYNRYVMTRNLWSQLSRVPPPVRSMAVAAIRLLPPGRWSALLNPLQSLLPGRFRMAGVGDKLHKAAGVLASKNVDALYAGLTTHWGAGLVIGSKESLLNLQSSSLSLEGLDSVQRMMATDAMTYLPDDILVKVDRAAMGVSLETRVPFLDHRVVEYAWRLPQHMKLRDGVGKWALRQVLYRHVPQHLVERPKMGFGVPIDSWLRGPLRDWAENLLDERRLREECYLNPGPIRQKWAEHLSGKFNWQHHLWDVLMFQAWLDEQSEAGLAAQL